MIDKPFDPVTADTCSLLKLAEQLDLLAPRLGLGNILARTKKFTGSEGPVAFFWSSATIPEFGVAP